MRYKIDVRFSGVATVEIEADSPAHAREMALELTLADLARSGGPDIRQFEIATRDITQMTQGTASDSGENSGESRPRPSGWYRPA